MVDKIKRAYSGLRISEFIRFWDASVNNDYVNRRVRELVQEEASRRGKDPEAFAKALEEVE